MRHPDFRAELRAQVCPVAATPGHTKELQSVQLERGIRVVDSPGVIFDDDDVSDSKGTKKGSVLLRNVIKVEDVPDPIAVGKHPVYTLYATVLTRPQWRRY